MDGYDALCELLDSGDTGVLTGVARVRSTASITGALLLSGVDVEAIQLTFDKLNIWILCIGENDEVAVLFESPPWPCPTSIDLSADPTWQPCLGERLVGAWSLTNNRGFDDAIQLEFETARLQLEGAASMIRTWSLIGVP